MANNYEFTMQKYLKGKYVMVFTLLPAVYFGKIAQVDAIGILLFTHDNKKIVLTWSSIERIEIKEQSNNNKL